MARRIPEQELEAILAAVARRPGDVTARDIAEDLGDEIPFRTLQYRIKSLVDDGRLVREGEGRWATYSVPSAERLSEEESEPAVPVSAAGDEIRAYLQEPAAARKPVGYSRAFLDSYRPNDTFYLLEAERGHLADVGKLDAVTQPAGTFAKHVLSRLIIDLSWNSSRLEGNTYSLLDTRRLIAFGEEAEGRDTLEAQMILNHKDAIAFLVSEAEEIGFDRYSILNLHAILANNLLPDPTAPGRLRYITVGIERSVFHPLEVPQLINECFDQILATAAAIEDPFEQAFFVMVQLPYLQPFDDVNKRVSRLAANIPLIKGNLSPLSFTDVPRSVYTQAVLGVYELNRIELLKDVFIWAYERSAARYAAVRQSLGDPDPFRLKYRDTLRTLIAEIVRAPMDGKAAASHIASWTRAHIEPPDRERFIETAETELLSLHEGSIARYRLRPSEFAAWQESWTSA
jgi:Fic family protein